MCRSPVRLSVPRPCLQYASACALGSAVTSLRRPSPEGGSGTVARRRKRRGIHALLPSLSSITLPRPLLSFIHLCQWSPQTFTPALPPRQRLALQHQTSQEGQLAQALASPTSNRGLDFLVQQLVNGSSDHESHPVFQDDELRAELVSGK